MSKLIGVKVWVTKNEEIGALSEDECNQMEKVRASLQGQLLPCEAEKFNMSVHGMHGVISIGGTNLYQLIKDLRGLDRLTMAFAPWAPNGQPWTEEREGEFYVVKWRLNIRPICNPPVETE